MQIKVWGCRGSLPTPGRTTLRYGGNTTCLEVGRADGTTLVIDAGSGIRYFGKDFLKREGKTEICLALTHSHWDHLMGFPYFVPAYFERYTLRLCGGNSAQKSIQKYLAHQMQPPFFPVDFSVVKATFEFDCQGPCDNPETGYLQETIPLNHPDGGLGFKLTENGRSFVLLTDNEIGFAHQGGLDRESYVEFCRGAHLLFHDAQYTERGYDRRRGWGHSTYEAAVDLALDAGVKRIGLFHHDPDRTDADLDLCTENCRQRIRAGGASLECFAVCEGAVYQV